MVNDLSQAQWRKSSYSGNTGNCVEIATSLPGIVAVRDTKDLDGGILRFTADEWRTFLTEAKVGEFDLV